MAAQSSKNELILGLTPSEAKVLILGIVSTNEGKVSLFSSFLYGVSHLYNHAALMSCRSTFNLLLRRVDIKLRIPPRLPMAMLVASS